MTYLEVANTLENFIEGKGGPWDWDIYITGVSFKDPYLQSIQARMASLSNEFPPTLRNHYCSEEGIEVIRNYVRELRDTV